MILESLRPCTSRTIIYMNAYVATRVYIACKEMMSNDVKLASISIYFDELPENNVKLTDSSLAPEIYGAYICGMSLVQPIILLRYSSFEAMLEAISDTDVTPTPPGLN